MKFLPWWWCWGWEWGLATDSCCFFFKDVTFLRWLLEKSHIDFVPTQRSTSCLLLTTESEVEEPLT